MLSGLQKQFILKAVHANEDLHFLIFSSIPINTSNREVFDIFILNRTLYFSALKNTDHEKIILSLFRNTRKILSSLKGMKKTETGIKEVPTLQWMHFLFSLFTYCVICSILKSASFPLRDGLLVYFPPSIAFYNTSIFLHILFFYS